MHFNSGFYIYSFLLPTYFRYGYSILEVIVVLVDRQIQLAEVITALVDRQTELEEVITTLVDKQTELSKCQTHIDTQVAKFLTQIYPQVHTTIDISKVRVEFQMITVME